MILMSIVIPRTRAKVGIDVRYDVRLRVIDTAITNHNRLVVCKARPRHACDSTDQRCTDMCMSIADGMCDA